MKIGKVLTINDTLQPAIWSDNELNKKVSQKLIKIAEDFFESLDLEGVEIDDITFTGSLANYNWTKYSDIDCIYSLISRKLMITQTWLRNISTQRRAYGIKCTKFL